MNEPSKLFRVLVLGGALFGAACTTDESSKTGASAPRDDAAAVSDEGVAVADADGADADGADAAEPTVDATVERELCVCEAAGECCESDASGASTARPGIECCWGSSC